MKNRYSRLHDKMKCELCHAWNAEKDEIMRARLCFRIAITFSFKLKEQVLKDGFWTEQEEIAFFRTVKPLFVCQEEYYALIYHALLFHPGEKSARITAFWREESERLQCFKKRHEDFCRYLCSNSTELDNLYFLRKNAAETVASEHCPNDGYLYSTSHDCLVSKFKAHELYHDYVREKIRMLV